MRKIPLQRCSSPFPATGGGREPVANGVWARRCVGLVLVLLTACQLTPSPRGKRRNATDAAVPAAPHQRAADPADAPPPAPGVETPAVPAVPQSVVAPQSEVTSPPPPVFGTIRGRLAPGAPADGLRAVAARPRRHAPRALAPVDWRFGTAFDPPLLVVGVGQEVWIHNDSDVCHQFFAPATPNALTMELLKPGATCNVHFAYPGVVHLYCSLHTGRQGSLLVVPAPYFAPIGADGEFTLADLPADEYVLEAVGPDLAAPSLRVTVPGEGADNVELPWRPGATRTRD